VPGLMRGVARTAVVAGTATAVSGRVARRQAEKYADRDAAIYADRQQAYEQQVSQSAPMTPSAPPVAAMPPPAAPGAGDDTVAQLQQLAAMRDQGVLTDEEFAAAKSRLLGT
jgi:hypothetical protein